MCELLIQKAHTYTWKQMSFDWWGLNYVWKTKTALLTTGWFD